MSPMIGDQRPRLLSWCSLLDYSLWGNRSRAAQWRGPRGEELKPSAESCVNKLGMDPWAPVKAADDSSLMSQPEPNHPAKLLPQS